jgi:uncharacterized protein with GYD domain
LPTFIRLVRYTDQGIRNAKDFPRLLREVRGIIEGEGGRVVATYAVTGPYDFVNIYEAKDEMAAMRISVAIGATGNFRSETMTAVPIERYAQEISR